MGFFRYIKEAFSARPWGMWVPPNWVGLAAFGMLGIMESGFWVLGAGLELGYLFTLASSRRFQRLVDGKETLATKQTAQQQVISLLARLSPVDQTRYRQLEQRCQAVLQQQHEASSPDLQMQADGLGKLLFVYLRLLLTRSAIQRVLEEGGAKSIDMKVSEVNRQLKEAATPDLQRSLTDQLEILAERKKRRGEAGDKLRFIDAELTRIQEQVELIREGLVVTSDPASLSRRIDQIGDTLGNTNQWIRQQQELYGQTEVLLDEPPPVVLEAPGKG